MIASPPNPSRNDDPRKLRELLQRASSLASDYDITSVMVGMSGIQGDLLFPEIVDYVGSDLRIDDSIFRMTRERVVLFLADTDRKRAEEIIERALTGFRENFALAAPHPVAIGYFEVTPESMEVSVKDVLPRLFASAPLCH